MGKVERISGDVDADVYAEVEAAVSRGELASPGELVNQLVTEWAESHRSATPEFLAYAKAMVEASLRDPGPGIPAEEVFAEMRARFGERSSDAS